MSTPPHPEVAALLAVLGTQRAHVLAALDGLSDDDLRRPVLPSGWSCLGLVRHLTLDDERGWFRAVVAGDPTVIEEQAREGPEPWDVPPDADPREILADYRAEIALADAIIVATPAGAPPRWWPREVFGDPWLHDLRDVMLHAITETARHVGHLDAVRELIDGHQWSVLDRGRPPR